jgi:hypothetical protein
MPDTAAPAAGSHLVEVRASDRSGTLTVGVRSDLVLEIGKAASFAASTTSSTGVIAIAALYFGREVFVPMACPPAEVCARGHRCCCSAVGSMAAVVLAFSVILGIGALIGSQVAPSHPQKRRPVIQSRNFPICSSIPAASDLDTVALRDDAGPERAGHL